MRKVILISVGILCNLGFAEHTNNPTGGAAVRDTEPPYYEYKRQFEEPGSLFILTQNPEYKTGRQPFKYWFPEQRLTIMYRCSSSNAPNKEFVGVAYTYPAKERQWGESLFDRTVTGQLPSVVLGFDRGGQLNINEEMATWVSSKAYRDQWHAAVTEMLDFIPYVSSGNPMRYVGTPPDKSTENLTGGDASKWDKLNPDRELRMIATRHPDAMKKLGQLEFHAVVQAPAGAMVFGPTDYVSYMELKRNRTNLLEGLKSNFVSNKLPVDFSRMSPESISKLFQGRTTFKRVPIGDVFYNVLEYQAFSPKETIYCGVRP